METAISNKTSTFLKIFCVVLAIILMFSISAVMALIIHENRGSGEVKVENGLSAYELAVQSGYEGTLQEWLVSLNGRSAYESAVANGYTGTEAEWAAQFSSLAESQAQAIKTASFNSKGELVLTLADNTELNLGKAIGTDGKDGKDGVNGKNGADGKNGVDGISITDADVNQAGELVLAFSDGKSVNVGKIVGATGAQGPQGETGEQGPEGVCIKNIKVDSTNRTMTITLTNNREFVFENMVGANGEDGISPQIRINATTNEWEISTDEGATWTATGVKATGEKGETGATGAQGKPGKDAIAPQIRINGTTNLWEISTDNGVNWTSTTIAATGAQGPQGETGLSAYEIALLTGKTTAATEAEWIESLKGEKGEKGDAGATGATGADGLSAYEVAQSNGVTLSEQEWLESLKGENGATGAAGQNGKSAYEIAKLAGLTAAATEAEWIESLKGEKGEKGDAGADGLSAYELAVQNGLTTAATEAQWLESLKGEAGRGIVKTEISGTNWVIYYTDGTTETHDLSGIAGDPNEKEVLVFSLLSDGTYGVMAGGMAQYEAVIEIPATYKGIAVTQIMADGFKDQRVLQSIAIPESITVIGNSAFQNCVSLDNVVLPSTLEKIGQYAFNGCTSLKSAITIPDTVNFIGKYAFYSTGLTSATFVDATGWKVNPSIMLISSLNRTFVSFDGTTFGNGGSWRYEYSYDLSNKSKAAKAFVGTVDVLEESTYLGGGVGSGETETDYVSAKLYTSDWENPTAADN